MLQLLGDFVPRLPTGASPLDPTGGLGLPYLKHSQSALASGGPHWRTSVRQPLFASSVFPLCLRPCIKASTKCAIQLQICNCHSYCARNSHTYTAPSTCSPWLSATPIKTGLKFIESLHLLTNDR